MKTCCFVRRLWYPNSNCNRGGRAKEGIFWWESQPLVERNITVSSAIGGTGTCVASRSNQRLYREIGRSYDSVLRIFTCHERPLEEGSLSRRLLLRTDYPIEKWKERRKLTQHTPSFLQLFLKTKNLKGFKGDPYLSRFNLETYEANEWGIMLWGGEIRSDGSDNGIKRDSSNSHPITQVHTNTHTWPKRASLEGWAYRRARTNIFF